MKGSLKTAVLLTFLAALPAGLVRAEDAPDAGAKTGAHHWDISKHQKKLGLSDDQVAKLKAIKDSEKTAMKPLWEKQKAFREKLEGQVKAKAADADIQATLSDMKANRKAMMDQKEQFQEQKAAILTPTQQAKMLLGRMKHEGHQEHDEGKE